MVAVMAQVPPPSPPPLVLVATGDDSAHCHVIVDSHLDELHLSCWLHPLFKHPLGRWPEPREILRLTEQHERGLL